MSNIEITVDNIKKFSKRLQKNAKEKGLELSLSESQELLAKTLGSNNFNTLLKTIEIKNGTESEKKLTFEEARDKIISTISDIENDQGHTYNKVYTAFYECLNYLLQFEGSKIESCYFEKKEGAGNFSFSFYNIFNEFDMFFNKYSNRPIPERMKHSAYSDQDAELMSHITQCKLFNFYTSEKESSLFWYNFYSLLNYKHGHKTKHILK